MSQTEIIQKFKNYQKTPKKQADYLRWFGKIMVYRTTKTENPGATLKEVERVFSKTGKNYDR